MSFVFLQKYFSYLSKKHFMITLIEANDTTGSCCKSEITFPSSSSSFPNLYPTTAVSHLFGIATQYMADCNKGRSSVTSQGSLFLVYRGETSLEKTPYFQRIYKKLSQFYKKKNSRLVPDQEKQCSIRMLVSLHTHYQMYLASKFTLF